MMCPKAGGSSRQEVSGDSSLLGPSIVDKQKRREQGRKVGVGLALASWSSLVFDSRSSKELSGFTNWLAHT